MEKENASTTRHKPFYLIGGGQLLSLCMLSLFGTSCLDDKDRCPEGMVLVEKEESAEDLNWFDVCIVPPETDTDTGTIATVDSGTQVVDTDTGINTDATDATDTSDATDTTVDTNTDTESDTNDSGTGVAGCTADSCDAGEYCDLTMDPPTCLLPPTGQGQTCAVLSDCAGFEANYCENALTNTCLKQNCDIDANNCSQGYMCCDFAWAGLPPTCVSMAYWGNTCYVPDGK